MSRWSAPASLSSDESPPSPVLSGPLERRPGSLCVSVCVCVCVCVCVDRLGCTVIIRIHNGFDSGALEQWTQHMPREITGWLTGYLTGWLVRKTASPLLINSDPLIQTDCALDIRPTLCSRLVSIASGKTTSLNYLFALKVGIHFAAVSPLFKRIQNVRERTRC